MAEGHGGHEEVQMRAETERLVRVFLRKLAFGSAHARAACRREAEQLITRIVSDEHTDHEIALAARALITQADARSSDPEERACAHERDRQEFSLGVAPVLGTVHRRVSCHNTWAPTGSSNPEAEHNDDVAPVDLRAEACARGMERGDVPDDDSPTG